MGRRLLEWALQAAAEGKILLTLIVVLFHPRGSIYSNSSLGGVQSTQKSLDYSLTSFLMGQNTYLVGRVSVPGDNLGT